MILISHRGNINGKNEELENYPDYIYAALNLGYVVEIDIRYHQDQLWLGHDGPYHLIDIEWLLKRSDKLWIHCKNELAVEYFTENDYLAKDLNWFWHEEDTLTLTSFGYVWVYPGKQPIKNSIAVMPELKNDDVSKCMGICSDIIEKYKK